MLSVKVFFEQVTKNCMLLMLSLGDCMRFVCV